MNARTALVPIPFFFALIVWSAGWLVWDYLDLWLLATSQEFQNGLLFLIGSEGLISAGLIYQRTRGAQPQIESPPPLPSLIIEGETEPPHQLVRREAAGNIIPISLVDNSETEKKIAELENKIADLEAFKRFRRNAK